MTLTVSIPEPLWQAAQREAQASGRTPEQVVVSVLEKGFSQDTQRSSSVPRRLAAWRDFTRNTVGAVVLRSDDREAIYADDGR
jgi:hypothetical protein